MNQLHNEIMAVLQAADQLGGLDTQFGSVIEAVVECLDDYSGCGTHELAVQMLGCLTRCKQLFDDSGALLLIEDIARCVREFKYEQIK